VQHFIDDHSDKLVTFSFGASSEDGNQPYKPFVSILNKFSMMDEKDLGEEATARLISLKGMLESDTSMVGDLAKEREMLLEAFTKFFESVSKTRILVLYLDNLQWCDEASVMLIQQLAMEMEECKLLLISNFRPEELEETEDTVHPITGLMATLMMQDRLNTMLIERFGPEETEELVAKMIGVEAVPERFLTFLNEKTEGSPLFIVELVESMIEQDLINLEDPNWAENLDLDRIRTPGGVKEIISRRLEHVEPEIREILNTASVLGSKFLMADLAELTGKDAETLAKIMFEAIEKKILFEDLDSAEEAYGFDHSKIRDVLYETIPEELKIDLHTKVGAILERKNRPLEHSFAMAHHFYRAKDHERAYRYAKMSGELSFGSHAPREAYQHFSYALDLLDSVEQLDDKAREKINLLNTIGKVGYITGDWDRSIEALEEAITISGDIGDAKLLVDSQVELGSILAFKGANNPKAIELFTAALVVAETESFEEAFAACQLGLGYVFWREGHYDIAEKHFKSCLSMATRLGNMDMVGEVFVDLGNLYSGKGDFPTGKKHYLKAIEILEPIENYQQLARTFNNLGDLYLKMSEWDPAIEMLVKCEETAVQYGYKNMAAWAQFNMAEAYAKKGDLDDALKVCSKALNTFYKMDDTSGITGAEKNMGIIYRFKKEWDKSEEHFLISINMLEEMNNLEFLIESKIELGEMYIDKGDTKKARDVLSYAVNKSAEIEAKEYEKRALGVMKRLEG